VRRGRVRGVQIGSDDFGRLASSLGRAPSAHGAHRYEELTSSSRTSSSSSSLPFSLTSLPDALPLRRVVVDDPPARSRASSGSATLRTLFAGCAKLDPPGPRGYARGRGRPSRRGGARWSLGGRASAPPPLRSSDIRCRPRPASRCARCAEVRYVSQAAGHHSACSAVRQAETSLGTAFSLARSYRGTPPTTLARPENSCRLLTSGETR
jgi:hypothetical protein